MNEEFLLTFEELRDKCIRHLKEASALCGSFTNPDKDFLLEEYSAICKNLRFNKVVYNHLDFNNAYWSAVFELEYKQKLCPGSVFILFDKFCKIDKFKNTYPIEIEFRVLVKNGYGKLKKQRCSTRIKEPVQMIFRLPAGYYPINEHATQLSLFGE